MLGILTFFFTIGISLPVTAGEGSIDSRDSLPKSVVVDDLETVKQLILDYQILADRLTSAREAQSLNQIASEDRSANGSVKPLSEDDLHSAKSKRKDFQIVMAELRRAYRRSQPKLGQMIRIEAGIAPQIRSSIFPNALRTRLGFAKENFYRSIHHNLVRIVSQDLAPDQITELQELLVWREFPDFRFALTEAEFGFYRQYLLEKKEAILSIYRMAEAIRADLLKRNSGDGVIYLQQVKEFLAHVHSLANQNNQNELGIGKTSSGLGSYDFKVAPISESGRDLSAVFQESFLQIISALSIEQKLYLLEELNRIIQNTNGGRSKSTYFSDDKMRDQLMRDIFSSCQTSQQFVRAIAPSNSIAEESNQHNQSVDRVLPKFLEKFLGLNPRAHEVAALFLRLDTTTKSRLLEITSEQEPNAELEQKLRVNHERFVRVTVSPFQSRLALLDTIQRYYARYNARKDARNDAKDSAAFARVIDALLDLSASAEMYAWMLNTYQRVPGIRELAKKYSYLSSHKNLRQRNVHQLRFTGTELGFDSDHFLVHQQSEGLNLKQWMLLKWSDLSLRLQPQTSDQVAPSSTRAEASSGEAESSSDGAESSSGGAEPSSGGAEPSSGGAEPSKRPKAGAMACSLVF